MADRWRRCSACKKDIALSSVYWVCSVSTCNRARTALVFCSVDCWEIHLPTERHRVAWAVEKRAPKVPDAADGGSSSAGAAGKAAAAAGAKSGAGAGTHSGPNIAVRPGTQPGASSGTGVRPVAVSGSGAPARAAEAEVRSDPTDVLVVASKLKTYIREGSGFNTSDRVLLVLSDVLRKLCDDAIRNAKRAGRDIVTDRDLPPPV